MAERVLRSPGVATREIDLSAPGRVQPQGIPAGVIGTSQKGPAFVPTVFANTTEFTNLFGASDGKYFGVMAVKEWLRNARSGLFLRVLGVGDGKKADANNITTNAGFLVGDKIRNQSSTALETDGAAIGRAVNPYAGAGTADEITLGTKTHTASVAGDEEISKVQIIGWSAATAYDGVYILIEASSAESSSAVPQKRLILLSSQAVGTGGTQRKVVGKTVVDGTILLHDFSSILTGTSDTLHIADVSGAGSAGDVATAIASISSASAGNAPAGVTIAVENTDEVKFTNLHKGDVGDISIGTISSNAAASYVDITGSYGVITPGVQIVDGVAFSQTITFGTGVPQDESFILITGEGGATAKIGFKSGGAAFGSCDLVIDTALAANDTGAELAGVVWDALTGGNHADTNQGATGKGGSAAALDANIRFAYTHATRVITVTQNAAAAGTQIAVAKTETNAAAAPGRIYFLGARMGSNSEDVDYFGRLQTDVELGTNTNKKILRGVLMFPSGVIPGLAAHDGGGGFTIPSFHASGAAYNDGYGNDIGSHEGGLQNGKFVMLLNGFNHTAAKAPRVITGSMDPLSPIYFAKVFNTDPTKIQEKGHYLHAHYDIPAGIGSHTTAANQNNAILAKGTFNPHAQAADFEAGSGYKPSFEKWEQKFEHAYTPWITSQTLGNSRKKLFRFWMLDAGSGGHGQIKISIANIQKSTDTSSDYGRFDVQIRQSSDLDVAPVILQTFAGVNLNPASDRYIARVIGDQNTFFEFEKADGKQKLVTEGLYPNNSQYVRVQVVDQIEAGMMEATALPCGFQGKHHLVLDGNALADSHELLEPPLPFRQNVSVGTGPTKVVDPRFYWGAQYQDIRVTAERNKETGVLSLVDNLTKWFPSTGGYPAWVGDNKGKPAVAGSTIDANLYNKNEFSLENIWVQCKSLNTALAVDPTQWHEAVYIRDGESFNPNGYKPYTTGSVSNGQARGTDFYQAHEVINSGASTGQTKSKSATNGWRYLDVSKDFGQSASKKYLKFTVPMQGGWDGLDIFDKDKSELNNLAAFREMDANTSSDLGGPDGPTVAAFRKGLDILAEKSDVDIQLLATPGMRVPGITDYAVDRTEERFDALYIMDMSAYDHDNKIVTQSTQETSVTNTVQNLANRNLDTSFAATYFPDLVIQDGSTNVVAPPSVAVLGAMSLNDSVAHPWFAPAGFARGALASTIETGVKLSRANMDVLYDGDVNPITSFPETGDSVVVFGQKTMLQAQSALDRVNVRRLLIDVRRKVRTVANQVLFEPNREATLARFSSLVNPILGRIQAQQGVERYKVVIDTTTTTQQDVENNTIRGKIFLQPTRSIEFISLDFVVTNAGAEI